MWLFVNEFKHRQIIYRWKAFFVISINSRLLPQNKAPFGSYQLAKFLFAWKHVPMIQSLSSKNEETIVKKELR